MDKLLTSAFHAKRRTEVTSLFASEGYKIAMTDFDDVIFERASVQVHCHFDRSASIETISITDEVHHESHSILDVLTAA